jgi:hypothetical protein
LTVRAGGVQRGCKVKNNILKFQIFEIKYIKINFISIFTGIPVY